MSAPAPAATSPAQAGGAAPATSRRRRRIATVVVLIAFLVLALAAALLQERTSSLPLAPDNPEPGGAMAAAEILGEQGVEVRTVRSWAALRREAGPGTTVFVPWLDNLQEGQYQELTASGADLTIGAGDRWLFPADYDELPVDLADVHADGVLHAECSDPDAEAASRVEIRAPGVTASPGADVEVCFPAADEPEAGIYAVWQEDGATVRHLTASVLVSNGHLAEHGHAALALRMLGHQEELLWYLPRSEAAAGGDPEELDPLLPPALMWGGAAMLAAAAVLALARARRLGPVVTEVMPVVVRAAETTRGRGRLYRRGRARDHAAEALRAGAASRMARALGLPRSAERHAVVDAVARASGRDTAEVDALIYGRPPEDDAGLLALSTMLDSLEREVHRS